MNKILNYLDGEIKRNEGQAKISSPEMRGFYADVINVLRQIVADEKELAEFRAGAGNAEG